jgi:hypothetical protein
MVFLNSPCRETPENELEAMPRKKNRLVSRWVWDLANVRGGTSILFWRPLGQRATGVGGGGGGGGGDTKD